MPGQQTIELLLEHFGYLMNEHGFKITDTRNFKSFGNWAVVLQLEKNCRIRVFQDRGEIFISFGPAWSPPNWEAGPWYDITVILKVLGAKSNELPMNTSNSSMQLEKFSQVIRPLIPEICHLFNEENYEKEKGRLEEIRRKLEADTWDKLIRKD